MVYDMDSKTLGKFWVKVILHWDNGTVVLYPPSGFSDGRFVVAIKSGPSITI